MTRRALILAVLANVLGGSSYVFTEYLLTGFDPASGIFIRTFLGMLLFLPFAIVKRSQFPREKSDWARMMAIGLFGYGAPLIVGYWGQKYSTATNAALLIGVEPISIVLLSALFLGERLTFLKSASIVGGVAGAALLVLQGIPLINVTVTPQLKGDVLLVLHGFFWSLYSVIGKPILNRIDPMVLTFITTVIGLIPMAVLAWPHLPSVLENPPGWQAWAALLYLAFALTFMGTLLWNLALKEAPASVFANFIFLQPLTGVLLGIFLQRDALTFWSLTGGALILAGMWCATRPEPAPANS